MFCIAKLRTLAFAASSLIMMAVCPERGEADSTWKIERLSGNPMITPKTDDSIGSNINGPSLIRVPKWIKDPLGKYYMYFADHNGKYIRLAYSDSVNGPWKIHKAGSLQLAESWFSDHIASPEAIVDNEAKQIRLYYHGLTPEDRAQHTRVALSPNGIAFKAIREPVGKASAYWRLFKYGEWWYALAMPGKLYRSKDGLTPFEAGPQVFPVVPMQVHTGIFLIGDVLNVFYTRSGDTPERIFHSTVNLKGDWFGWQSADSEEILAPEREWEGADLPLVKGTVGALHGRQRALRDPAVFHDGSELYLAYAIAGESGIAIAKASRSTGRSIIQR